jgi:hypothetical protein
VACSLKVVIVAPGRDRDDPSITSGRFG